MKFFVSSVALFGLSSAMTVTEEINYKKTEAGDECTWRALEDQVVSSFAKEDGKFYTTGLSDLDTAKKECLRIDAKPNSKCTAVVGNPSKSRFTPRHSTFVKSSQWGETAYVPSCGKLN